MNVFDRYLLKEITIPFVVGLVLFFSVIVFGQLLKISDSLTGLGVSGEDIFRALTYSIPTMLGILIPVSLLFAIMLAVGRLASDRELIGMSVVGRSPYSIFKVPFLLGVCLSLLTVTATIWGEPWGIQGLRDLMARSAQRALAQGVRAGEFNEWLPGVTLFVQRKVEGGLDGVFFSDRRDEDHPILISSRRGHVHQGQATADLIWELEDGALWVTDKVGASFRMMHFEKSLYKLDVGRLVGNKARTLPVAQGMRWIDLWEAARDGEQSPTRSLYLVTLHRKLALPVAAVVFALLAVPLAWGYAQGARARGFLYSTAIVAAYYYIGRAAELQARNADFSPVLAAWLPNLLGLLTLVLLLIYHRRGWA